MRVSLTGATGFIGRRLLERLVVDGYQVSALIRDKHSKQSLGNLEVNRVTGALGDEQAEAKLVEGADCVIHLAGATHAVDINEFHRINTIGAARLAAAASKAGVRHFILVSSLAAREPRLSDYSQTKHLAEIAVRRMAGSMPVTIFRPPAVFGAGDPATAPLFAALQRGFFPVPGGRAGRQSKLSVIHVDDLVNSLMVQLRYPQQEGDLIEPYGQKCVSWQDMLQAAEKATGRRVKMVPIPPLLMKAVGTFMDIGGSLARKPVRYSGGKVREILHADWVGAVPAPTCSPLEDAFAASLGLAKPQTKLNNSERQTVEGLSNGG